MPLAEIVHVPTVVSHRRHHHFEQEVIVDDHVPHERDGIVNVSKIIPQERVIQETVEQVLEVPVPMHQENTVRVPTVVNHHRHQHLEQVVLVDVYVTHEN